MMTPQLFKRKAAEQNLLVDHINVNKLLSSQLSLHLQCRCVCCGGDTDIDVVYDDDFVRIIGYTTDLLCIGCEEHVPDEFLKGCYV